MNESKNQKQDKAKGGSKSAQNTTGEFMHVFGIALMVLGAVVAVLLLVRASEVYGSAETTFQIYAGISFISSLITGSLFVGMAEIIKLLDRLTGTDSSHTESS